MFSKYNAEQHWRRSMGFSGSVRKRSDLLCATQIDLQLQFALMPLETPPSPMWMDCYQPSLAGETVGGPSSFETKTILQFFFIVATRPMIRIDTFLSALGRKWGLEKLFVQRSLHSAIYSWLIFDSNLRFEMLMKNEPKRNGYFILRGREMWNSSTSYSLILILSWQQLARLGSVSAGSIGLLH